MVSRIEHRSTPLTALRACAFAVSAALIGAGLSACSPRAVGAIGIAKDAAGQLVVVTDACNEELDYLRFTRTRDGGPIATAADGQLTYDRQDLGTFRLTGEQRRLTVIGTVPVLEDGAHYTVGAWDDDQDVSAGPIAFRADDLAALPVGEVYRMNPTDAAISSSSAASNDGQPSRMTVDQWLAAPCAEKP